TTSSDAFHPQIFTLLHRFQLDHPGVTLHQMEDNMANLMTALSEAELDIAFVRLPCESSKAFNLRIIDEEPMVIALPRDNPLATQPTLALEQLRDVAPLKTDIAIAWRRFERSRTVKRFLAMF
ncbi:LysR substrate-binding domain-containing protein, partial [Klebsiella pneumoniae]|uniref:LysR substrate-binding domain-containing protein n=1 Tax=Klebsiella pneumoniae TaxID=573 RepID=UPI001F536702